MYLLDTSFLIDLAREKEDGRSQATLLLEGLPESPILYVSAITLGQLAVGEHLASSQRGRKRNATLREWITALCEILSFQPNHAEHFGRIAALLHRKSRLIPESDVQLAATAVAEGLTLITRDRRHFGRIPGLRVQGY